MNGWPRRLAALALCALAASCGDNERLEQRMETLEQHQERVDAALDRTVQGLDVLIRHLRGDSATANPAAEAEPPTEPAATEQPQPAEPPPQTQPDLHVPASASWWTWLPLLLAAVGLLAWTFRRTPRAPGATPRDPRPAAEPSPPPRLTPVPGAEVPARVPEYPREVALDFEHPDADSQAEAIAGWLAEDPRVLVTPEPEIAAEGNSVHLRYWLVPGLATGEVDQIEAEIAALSRRGGAAGGAQASSQTLASSTFLRGKEPEPGYTPRPSPTSLR